MRLNADDLASERESISLHEFGLLETLEMAKQLNCGPREVIIIGVKPKDVSPGVGISEEISSVVPHIMEEIFGLF